MVIKICEGKTSIKNLPERSLKYEFICIIYYWSTACGFPYWKAVSNTYSLDIIMYFVIDVWLIYLLHGTKVLHNAYGYNLWLLF